MAFYLFLRFHVANEPWPDFSDMVRWQKIKLLRTRDDPMKKLSYHAQNLAIKNCFRDHNINLVGHILDEKRAVSWAKHSTFQMRKFDD